MMRWITLSLIVAATAGAAAPSRSKTDDPAARLTARLAGLTAQKPVDCLPGTETRFAHTVAYGSTILYEVNRSNVYRTETNGGCEGLGRDDILVVRSNFGQVCSGDIAQTIDRGSRFPTGSCALGQFTPYHK